MRLVHLAFIFTSSVALAQGFSPGAWQLADAYCSNPDYTYSPDEQFFIDAIKSGMTVDQMRFQEENSGEVLTRFNMGGGVACVGRGQVQVSYLDEAKKVEMSYSKLKWEAIGVDENTSVECSGGDQPFEITHTFHFTSAGELVFSFPSGEDCGSYNYVWTPLIEIDSEFSSHK